jgi:hypothetical protein
VHLLLLQAGSGGVQQGDRRTAGVQAAAGRIGCGRIRMQRRDGMRVAVGHVMRDVHMQQAGSGGVLHGRGVAVR